MNTERKTSNAKTGFLLLTAALTVSLVAPVTASAQPNGHFSIHAGGDRWSVSVGNRPARAIQTPVTHVRRSQRVWREPVYEIRRVLVTVPAKVITRRVPNFGPNGWIIGTRLIEEVVAPARQVWREQRVLVRAGYYETMGRRPPSRRSMYRPDRPRREPWRGSNAIRVSNRHGDRDFRRPSRYDRDRRESWDADGRFGGRR